MMNKLLLSGLVTLLVVDPASAGFIVCPGDVPVTNGDGAFDILAVDLNAPVTLAAGTYTAATSAYREPGVGGAQRGAGVETLYRRLETVDFEVRARAAELVGKRREAQALEPLLALFNPADARVRPVRRSAVRRLFWLRDSRIVGPVVRRLGDPLL